MFNVIAYILTAHTSKATFETTDVSKGHGLDWGHAVT
jgi:hypothetical protein